jgi:hypothetical protein
MKTHETNTDVPMAWELVLIAAWFALAILTITVS